LTFSLIANEDLGDFVRLCGENEYCKFFCIRCIFGIVLKPTKSGLAVIKALTILEPWKHAECCFCDTTLGGYRV